MSIYVLAPGLLLVAYLASRVWALRRRLEAEETMRKAAALRGAAHQAEAEKLRVTLSRASEDHEDDVVNLRQAHTEVKQLRDEVSALAFQRSELKAQHDLLSGLLERELDGARKERTELLDRFTTQGAPQGLSEPGNVPGRKLHLSEDDEIEGITPEQVASGEGLDRALRYVDELAHTEGAALEP